MNTAKEIADKLVATHTLCDGEVFIDLGDYKISVRSNSEALLHKLGIYFAHTLGQGDADINMIAIDGDEVDLGIEYTDWAREPGKTGRKDACFDLKDARLVHKVRTGMTFLQSQDHIIVSGPSLENDNQIINFINAQYMSYLQQNDALICHASGLVYNDKCLAMAGFSGGGKSTLMLHMLDEEGVTYLTNDRLFLQQDGTHIKSVGIPKLPRINPGTILNNPTLRPLLSDQRCDELRALPLAELWDLEEKYDVFVEDVYGEGKITAHANLDAFLILNWQRDATTDCEIKKVDLVSRTDLLDAVMKSPGPFYQYSDGSFFKGNTKLEKAPYLEHLKDVTLFEVTGKVDFDYAARFCLDHLKG